MRAREKDGIEPGEWLARQQTVPHRQFLPPRLEGVRFTERSEHASVTSSSSSSTRTCDTKACSTSKLQSIDWWNGQVRRELRSVRERRATQGDSRRNGMVNPAVTTARVRPVISLIKAIGSNESRGARDYIRSELDDGASRR